MKPVKGFEGLYSVDQFGNVFSHPKTVKVGVNGGVRRQPMQTIKSFTCSKRTDHLRVYLAKEGKKFPRFVHRLVAQAYIPNPDNLPFINHKDGNPQNNAVENLEWCDGSYNSTHAYANGLKKPVHIKGENNGQSKLTADNVREIRRRRDSGETNASIARSFGVKPKTISMITLRQRWAHID